MERAITGIGLLSGVLLLVRLRMLWVIMAGVVMGAIYDFGNLPPPKGIMDIPLRVSCLYLVVYSTLIGYWYFSPKAVFAITVAQLGDVCQYLVGRHWPYHKIGWISPNKTYEGYVGGFVLMMCILPVLFRVLANIMDIDPTWSYRDAVVFYILGCVGGLYFSYAKRIIGVKDWSDILGKHGGFLDRLDSICFPLLYAYY